MYSKRKATRPGTTRRVRMLGYQYSTPGYYFVTICAHNRNHYFGSITSGLMALSLPGMMVGDTVRECESHFASVSVDSLVVMPNHIHILIGLAVRLTDEPEVENLIDVIQWIKSTCHQRFRAGVIGHGWPPFDGVVWQEGFHDHIVRNDGELEALRNYIASNVEMWEKDRFHDGFQD